MKKVKVRYVAPAIMSYALENEGCLLVGSQQQLVNGMNGTINDQKTGADIFGAGARTLMNSLKTTPDDDEVQY